jgi:hypothetical protein
MATITSRNGHVYDRATFDRHGMAHEVYRRGSGPAVILIHEAGGLNWSTLDIADRLIDEGFRVLAPQIVGPAYSSDEGSAGTNIARLCVSREVHVLLTGRTSPIAVWLRALAADAKGDHAGVGVIGMCFSGGFALAAAVDESVVAAVASQPALPWPVLPGSGSDLGLSPDDVACVLDRYRDGAFGLLAARYTEDKRSACARIERYKTLFGADVVMEPIGIAHSVLARAANPSPDREAVPVLTRTIELLKARLLPA